MSRHLAVLRDTTVLGLWADEKVSGSLVPRLFAPSPLLRRELHVLREESKTENGGPWVA